MLLRGRPCWRTCAAFFWNVPLIWLLDLRPLLLFCTKTQEFENAEGEEYQADVSTLASPATQTGPEVYILPLTQVSRPLNKQPGRSGN